MNAIISLFFLSLQFSNIIFLESPACVGFSYTTECTTSDDQTSLRNYNALLDFYDKVCVNHKYRNQHTI